MPLFTFDPNNGVLILGGTTINGFEDGEYLNVARYNDSFNLVSGADGITSRAKTNDKTGNFTITLAQTSPSNAYLSTLAIADEATGSGVFPVIFKELNTTTLFFSGTGWIKKPADAAFSKGEISGREWIIDVIDLEIFSGGNVAIEGAA